jgi:hypothetical protein
MVTSPVRIAKKLLLGAVFGDASLSVHSGLMNAPTKSMLTLIQGEDQFEYLIWKMHLLYPLVGNFHIKKFINKSTGKMILHAVTTHQRYLWHIWNDYYDLEKVDNQKGYRYNKVVKMNVLRRLSPLSFAIWYQDDGSLYVSEGRFKGIRLATYGFTVDENIAIHDHLRDMWNIDSMVDIRSDGYPCIRLRKQNSEKFLEMISPFVHSSMTYKTIPFSQSARHVYTHDEIVCSLQQCGELVRNNQSNMKSKHQVDWSELVKGSKAFDAMRLRVE